MSSSQAIFDEALSIERELNLNFWDSECPKNSSISFSIINENKIIQWTGYTKKFYQAVDQRLKFSRWIRKFLTDGGNIITKSLSIEDLNILSRKNDLVIIATGKDKLGDIFEINNKETVFSKPQRKMALIYVHGIDIDDTDGVSANIIPELGEYFIMPGLSTNGPCHMMLFEGKPNTEMDCWDEIKSPTEILKIAKKLLKKHLPEEYEKAKFCEIADENSYLTGSLCPKIRYPFFKENQKVVGLGDAIILNDPISGQGANIATRSAKIYAKNIINNTQGFFDKEWICNTFNEVWKYAKLSKMWSNMLLSAPTQPVLLALSFAQNNQKFANNLAEGFNNLELIFPWILSEESTNLKIKEFL